ncbi:MULTISPECIES: non-ribosomal peptide synthetase [unclassified Moorena]|uniref:non-ribosomal peptide synthetase n=2 Tax=Moorena TaxID=1155738 RepID=UPI0014012305|nr:MULTISPECIES: non-ribosomal peptide synthetase [unclassified Moorena]NEO16390.1 amino acid adenylation domain-containing protein [Moorena sp. SIO3E8]NEO45667.1 amino acid adenylation domain-containing protein [Moorena sp. SIO4A3]NEQ02951.1 amino acid adenylation domain-containing protein [Moorena sp. SIO3F7]
MQNLFRENDQYFFPLSQGQQALWFIYQKNPESLAYNIFITTRLAVELDLEAWRRAWQKLVERHSILRTTYRTRDGKPVAVVSQDSKIEIEVTDASGWDEDELKTQILVAVEGPFNLETGPVLRLGLFARSTQEFVQLIALHHIVGDGWSFDLLLKEFQILYAAEVKKFPEAKIANLLPDSPWQYADYVSWATQMLESARGEELFRYWHQTLADSLPTLNLPTDRRRPKVLSGRNEFHIVELDGGLIKKLRQLAAEQGVSLYRIMLAAFFVLLHRLSGQDDILLGSPMAARWSVEEFKSIVGYFANEVVLRANLADNPTFAEFLARIHRTVTEAQAHQDYPFDLLVQRLNPPRDASRNPLIQVDFTWRKHRWYNPQTPERLAGEEVLSMEPYLAVHEQGSEFDLILGIEEIGKSLHVIWEYSADLFDAKTIHRWARQFICLLESIVTNPEQQIAFLPLLTGEETHQLLVQWNNNFTDYPQYKCIHQLFEEQVQRTPDSVAVVFQQEKITYRELNDRANQLARYLESIGVGLEEMVGICVERSIEMMVGLLGILKAGGAYLPLDPSYPRDRLAYLLQDSQLFLLLASEKSVARLPESQGRIVFLDKDWSVISQYSQENLGLRAKPTSLAYVIYTSGSTGKPKGVQVEHQSLVNAYRAWEQAYQLSPENSHLQMASFSFDVFTGNWVRALCSGAKLVLCPREFLLEPEKLYRLMLQEQVDCAEFVPAVMRYLIEYLENTKQNLDFMGLLVIGSDSWSVKEYQKFRQFCGAQTRLVNSYGASEATIDSCYFESTEINLPLESPVPIGKPFANILLYILDDALQPVPIGVPGELHIGGVGLARGYFNRPELTAQKFIANPFSQEAGARLYKTGDKARYLPDGNIELLGRIDNQVKIRGFRIEPGEIESVLATRPEVGQSAVIVREDQAGHKRLVAYVVPTIVFDRPRSLSPWKNWSDFANNPLYRKQVRELTPKLRDFLKQKLPDYMVPSAFVMLDSLPLTPNGKIDRRALPAPEGTSGSNANFIAPRDTLELQLAQIWSEVLEVSPVGVRDNFFDIGGHSLLAIALIARVQRQFDKNLSLATLLQNPTIEQLATSIRSDPDSRSMSTLVAMQPDGNLPPLFLVPASSGTVLFYLDLVRNLGTEQPIYGLQAPGLNGEREPFSTLKDLAIHHIKGIKTIQPRGPYYLVGFCVGGHLALEMAQQLHQQGDTLALLGLIQSSGPEHHRLLVDSTPGRNLGLDIYYPREFAQEMGAPRGKEVPVSVAQLQQLMPEERLGYVLERAKMFDLLPEEVKVEDVESLFEVFKTTAFASYNYEPQPYPGNIALFNSSEQPIDIAGDPTLGWRNLVGGEIEVHEIPGDHFSVIREPQVLVLAERLKLCRDRALAAIK